MQLVFTADVTILRQAQDGHYVDAFDGGLIARVDDEDLDWPLFLEDEIGDDHRQHGSTFGEDANLDGGLPARIRRSHVVRCAGMLARSSTVPLQLIKAYAGFCQVTRNTTARVGLARGGPNAGAQRWC